MRSEQKVNIRNVMNRECEKQEGNYIITLILSSDRELYEEEWPSIFLLFHFCLDTPKGSLWDKSEEKINSKASKQ